MMPRKSGIDALRELRAAGVETPALIVSAHQDPSDADAPTDLEISGYLTKPIDFDLLLETVAELTAKTGRARSRAAGARVRDGRKSGKSRRRTPGSQRPRDDWTSGDPRAP